MTLFWIILIIGYFLLNAIITMAWMVGEEEFSGMVIIEIIVLFVFGIFVMTVSFTVAMVKMLVEGDL